MNKNKLTSKALEVNLAETRKKKIIIPEAHLWFISLSQDYFGINKRAQEFMQEYHHPYPNQKVISDLLKKICLEDFWFYEQLTDSQKAIKQLLEIFSRLLRRADSEYNNVLHTFLKLITQLKNPQNLNSAVKMLEEHYSPKYLANAAYFRNYLSKLEADTNICSVAFNLTKKVALDTLKFWQETTKVEDWYRKNSNLFIQDYSGKIEKIGREFFLAKTRELEEATSWQQLKQMLLYNDIANLFRQFTNEFSSSIEKIYFLFYLLHLPGMKKLNNHLLWDMNRLLGIVKNELEHDELLLFLQNIFRLFKEFQQEYTGTVLDCVSTLGKEIILLEETDLIDYFIENLIDMGFVDPGQVEITNDWQLEVDKNHIKNIRVWLELIELEPYKLQKLLSALIVNLRIGGIFISDTDLFQRDITKLLNSKMAPLFKQVKQLCRLFPVYYHEIGAEGELRDLSTKIDELNFRKDRLIHFFRKNVHTESNNTHVLLARKILEFWRDGQPDDLKGLIPQNVMQKIDMGAEYFQNVHSLINKISQNKSSLQNLINKPVAEIQELLSQQNAPQKTKEKLTAMLRLYQLLREKYSFETTDVEALLLRYRFFRKTDIKRLKRLIEQKKFKPALKVIFKFMQHLKTIILDSKKTEGWENIYYKRHIAAGIPSMYGNYHEPKFEALGLTFRLEKIAAELIQQIIDNINMNYITAKSLRRIRELLKIFQQGLGLDGIYNQGFNSNLQMFEYSLSSASFSLDQYVNIFQFMAEDVKEIISEYFLRLYDQPLKKIVPQIIKKQQSHEKCDENVLNQTVHKVSEKYYREILSSAFLVQTLDNFIFEILNTLRRMLDNFSLQHLQNVMTHDPDIIVSPFYRETVEMDNPIFIGAKAYFLKKLYLYGFPIPPGFVLTTELFRHKDVVLRHKLMNNEIDVMIKKHLHDLEKISGSKFGDSKNPLLLSVRSGTAISMPGAMNTFLNVGLNDEIVENLSKQPDFGWTAWDCYRRFLQSWAMSFGIERDIFDKIIIEFKNKYDIEQKIDFEPWQMKEIALSYKKILQKNNIEFETEPFKQLKQAVLMVFESWDSDRAKVYREHLQIANEWGTAVVIQKMVLGNISEKSGSGVLFTHNPYAKKAGINLYGDYTACSQGEDIVAGLVHVLPVSQGQRSFQNNNTSLQQRNPKIYAKLQLLAQELINQYGFSHQEIEFTFESDDPNDLYILQIRDQNIKQAQERVTFAVPSKKMQLVGRGIGIGGGALNGILAVDMQDLEKFKTQYPQKNIILVRPDTVPDDIGMVFECDGLLTGRGGATSHAAVTAVRLGKDCIVNCKELYVDEKSKICTINGVQFEPGDPIAIDGHFGSIYQGNYPTQTEKIDYNG